MPTDAITHQPDDYSGPGLPDTGELTPSVMVEDEPTFSRVVGFVGAALLLVGAVVLISRLGYKRDVILSTTMGVLSLVIGIACLLFHATVDRDSQLRRVYLLAGGLILAIGVLISLLPHPIAVGDLFGYGFGFMVLALLFVLAPLRNETDTQVRDNALMVLGGAGAAMAAIGLAGGNIKASFLTHYGLLIGILGLLYLVAYVMARGTSNDFAYRVGRWIGHVGALVFVIALLRSIYPPLMVWWGGESSAPAGYFTDGGGLLLMILGMLYVIVSLGLCSDRPIVVLTRRELGSFFYSPIAYFVLFAFVLAAAMNFLEFSLQVAAYAEAQRGMPEPIVRSYVRFWPIISMLVAVPVLTMRLLSEEQRTGTIEVLLTAPVAESTVVLSKFLAAWILFLTVFIPYGLLLVALRVVGGEPFDAQPLLAFFIALAVTGAGFVAMGLFCSALTRNQIASAVLCFVGMLALLFVVILRFQFFPTEADSQKAGAVALTHISYYETWQTFLGGRFVPSLLLFHASMAIVFLFLTVKWLEARKWR